MQMADENPLEEDRGQASLVIQSLSSRPSARSDTQILERKMLRGDRALST